MACSSIARHSASTVRRGESREATATFLAQTPLTPNVRKDILRIEHGDEDYLPALTSAQKKDRLSRISYEHYLLKVVKADPGILPYYLHATDGWWGCGIDAVSALDCWGTEYSGFQGLKLEPGETPRMGFTPAGTLTAVGFKFGRWVDSVFMQRALGAGDSLQP